ncbi:hypothetical protein [Komarekiella delphini-convector]|nr:hypothetical protein [Komarekiella delphini-convector]
MNAQLIEQLQVKYQDFEPYYTEAEKLYQVHGKSGDDPTEPYDPKMLCK